VPLDKPLDKTNFYFWVPPDGFFLLIGAEERRVELPQIPCPLDYSYMEEISEPGLDEVGKSLYDYLLKFPGCPLSDDYVLLLEQLVPHYFGEMGLQLVLLEKKDDPESVLRRYAYIKIMSQLQNRPPGIQSQLGAACYQKTLLVSELFHIRQLFAETEQTLTGALEEKPPNVTVMNYLARIHYVTGDYDKAVKLWAEAAASVADKELKQSFLNKMHKVKNTIPDYPLLNSLETLGMALQFYRQNDLNGCGMLLERLAVNQHFLQEFPYIEFYLMLAECRKSIGERQGALQAYQSALAIDSENIEAINGVKNG